jgi:hypothetical protein
MWAKDEMLQARDEDQLKTTMVSSVIEEGGAAVAVATEDMGS